MQNQPQNNQSWNFSKLRELAAEIKKYTLEEKSNRAKYETGSEGTEQEA